MPDKLAKTVMLADTPVKIYQRSQIIMIGVVPAPYVVECFYVLPAPEQWPKVQIQARRGFAKLWYRFVSQSGIMLDDNAFNAAFKVTSKDEEFAIMLLTPELQNFILEKRNVDWSVGKGSIKLWYKGKLRKILIDHSLKRLARFESLIAEELYTWA